VTLRGRLALVNVVVLLIALLLLAGIVLNQLVRDLYEQLDHDLALIGARELAIVKVVHGIPTLGNNSQPLPQIGLEGFIRLVDTQGRIVDGVGAFSDTPVSTQTLDAPPQGLVFNQTSHAGLPLRVYTRPVLTNNTVVGFLQVANERDEVEETLQLVRRSLIFGIPLALLISGLISLLTARQALRPLTQMTQSAAAIGAQDLTARLPVFRAKDEVQALALTFNATLDRLAAAFVRQRRFIADASHELRTPVTAILGQAELALSRPRDPKAYQATLTRIRQEAERMQRLIGRMLTLARVETGRQPLTVAPTDVARLIHTLLDTVQPQAEAKGLTLKASIPDTLTIPSDADSLTQILLNLLENAITYTDQGVIELTLTTTDDHVCLTVSDTGQGIPPDHMPHIFQPFYRVDPSRSQSRGSVGLGLTLTYELTRVLGGDLEVNSKPLVGTTFTLSLPLESTKSSM
jgi:heavy metal sensor kinase